MPNNKTITINGRVYDAVTGLPINGRVYDAVSRVPKKTTKRPTSEETSKEEVKPKKEAHVVERGSATAAAAVHTQAQRSQTLHRRATKKPTPAPAATKRPTSGRHMDMARSSKISKFAPQPVEPQKKTSKAPAVVPDKAPQVHPVAAKAAARVAAAKPVVSKPLTPKEVKDIAISRALATPKAKAVKEAKKHQKWVRRIVISGSIFLAIALILFAVYRFIPSVSVGLASTQAGVKASYPEYVPDGYSLAHPVTFEDGEVALKFQSNTNKNSYTITQTRSSWDSSAVLDNIVRPDSGDNYITTKERGLTVYSYDNNAAWVNAGILYVIASDNAPLSGEQIRHIATSL